MPLRPKHRALWLLPPRGQPLTSPVGQVTLTPVRLLESAYRHGVSASDIRHAAANAIRHHDLDDGLVMLVGPDTTGALLARSEERREGKSGSVRVDLGGSRTIKKKKKNKNR